MARIHSPAPLHAGQVLALPPTAARHVQVLRMQPGQELTLFDGRGGEWQASIEKIGRSDVQVRVGAHDAVEREPQAQVHLAVGIPANERMDWLVEKATELGVASLQPLLTERSVLRVQGERAARKQEHWQAIAIAACEQSGRNRLPLVHPIVALAQWQPPAGMQRCLLSPAAGGASLDSPLCRPPVLLVSGPEGGFGPGEEDALRACGFLHVWLGPRVLRAETAPLAALAALVLHPAMPATGDSR